MVSDVWLFNTIGWLIVSNEFKFKRFTCWLTEKNAEKNRHNKKIIKTNKIRHRHRHRHQKLLSIHYKLQHNNNVKHILIKTNKIK